MGSVTVDIPSGIAERMAAELEAGRYRSESEIVIAGLEALLTSEDTIEGWLRQEVLDSCREMSADPSRAIPIADAEKRLRERTRDLT